MRMKAGILCMVLAGMLLAVACGKKEEIKAGDPCIYYVNIERDSLVKMPYEFVGDSAEEEVEKALEDMRKVSDSTEYQSAFFDDLKVEKWELISQNVLLYFGKEYKKLDHAKELLLRAAVVQTLTQIKGVDGVCIYVDNSPLKAEDGQEIGVMMSEEFVENTGSSLYSYQEGKFRLYFANKKGDKLLAEDRNIRYNSNMSQEKLIVEKLVKGPGDVGKPLISPKTEVRSVSVKDGICYVNFNKEFLNTAYKVDPYITIYALVNSIVENGVAGQVQILVDGETNVVYQGHVDLSKPFSANYDYVEEKD